MMSDLLESGFTDTFRDLNGDEQSFTTYETHPMIGRLEMTGMRSDYFLVSDHLKHRVEQSIIRTDIIELPNSPIELLVDFQ